MKSTYPDLEKENYYAEMDNEQDWSFSRQEAMEKWASQAKRDKEYILFLKKMNDQLYENFYQYVKERLKVERESARTLQDVNTATVTGVKDVETRLWYIEQFIDIVSEVFKSNFNR